MSHTPVTLILIASGDTRHLQNPMVDLAPPYSRLTYGIRLASDSSLRHTNNTWDG